MIQDFVKNKKLKDIFYLSDEKRHKDDHFMDPNYKFVNLLHVKITDFTHFTKLKELRDILNSINFDNPNNKDISDKLLMYLENINYVFCTDDDALVLNDINRYIEYKKIYYSICRRLIPLIRTFNWEDSENFKQQVLNKPLDQVKYDKLYIWRPNK